MTTVTDVKWWQYLTLTFGPGELKTYNITLYSSFAKKVISATASRFWNQIKNV